MRYLLGTGILTWDKSERIDGRYGFVYLLNSGDSFSTGFDPAPLEASIDLLTKEGKLVAHVIKTRESTHCGDQYRRFYPETPAIGEEILLGRGKFTAIKNFGGTPAVGLVPNLSFLDNPPTPDTFTVFPTNAGDNTVQFHRNTYDVPWLDPKALYRAHEQTVKLYFETDNK